MLFKGKLKNSWDYQLDFKKAKEVYLKYLKRFSCPENLKELRYYYAVSIALIMLLNGCRVSEAIEALNLAAATDKREVEVKVRKKKNPIYRKIFIPKVIDFNLIRQQLGFWQPKKRNYIHKLLKELFGHNCHSCRYAFITFLGVELKIPPTILQKITKHSSLDMLSHYIEDKQAEREFINLFKTLEER